MKGQNADVGTHKTQRDIVMAHIWIVKFLFNLLLNPSLLEGFFCYKTMGLMSRSVDCRNYCAAGSSATEALGELPNLNRMPISWALKFKPDNWSAP